MAEEKPAVAATSVEPAIELAGVQKAFRGSKDQVQAVERVDLTIQDGEFFSLLGPSGCGKTTTLRMIAGFEDPTVGSIRLHGKEVVGVGPNKRDVNMVFQSYALFPHLTIWDNIAFGLRRKGLGKQEISRRVDEMIGVVELEGREKRMPRELSGGQQQRVALARALVNRPRALLLDEPLAALDLKLRQAMQLELKRIQREVGITFVFVTHDQSEALTMSDRIAVMNLGRVEQVGSPEDLYERPATPFVAQFIGTSNLMTLTSTGLEGANLVVDLPRNQRLSIPALPGQRVGEETTFSVRPEKVAVALDGQAPAADSRLIGTIDEVVYLGTSTSYVVGTELGSTMTVFEKNDREAATLHRGQQVWLSWSAANTHSFPHSRNSITPTSEEETR